MVVVLLLLLSVVEEDDDDDEFSEELSTDPEELSDVVVIAAPSFASVSGVGPIDPSHHILSNTAVVPLQQRATLPDDKSFSYGALQTSSVPATILQQLDAAVIVPVARVHNRRADNRVDGVAVIMVKRREKVCNDV